METLSEFSLPLVLFLLTLAFGFWLSRFDRPYNGILFNLHKLIALGTVLVTAVRLSNLVNGAESLALIVLLLILAAIAVVALFASGALMSAGKLDHSRMLAIHRIGPFVFVIALALAINLINQP